MVCAKQDVIHNLLLSNYTNEFKLCSVLDEKKTPKNPTTTKINNIIDRVFPLQFVNRCCVSLPGKQQQVLSGLSGSHPSLQTYWSNHRYIWSTESGLWRRLWSVWCWLDCWPNSEVSCILNHFFHYSNAFQWHIFVHILVWCTML